MLLGVTKEELRQRIQWMRQDVGLLEKRTERLQRKLEDQEDILIALADRLGYRIERETRKYVIVEKSDEQPPS